MLIATTLLSSPRRRNWGRISPIPTPGTERTAMSIKRHGVGPRLSQAAVHGDTVYLAGMVAGDPSADTKGQSEQRSEEHTSELQSLAYLVCRLLLEKKKKNTRN